MDGGVQPLAASRCRNRGGAGASFDHALARDARCHGVVCSVREVADLKSFFGGEFATLCPGIRPSGAAHGDQKRAATPTEAQAVGADYIVVGRPIVEATDPVAAANAILDELRGVRA